MFDDVKYMSKILEGAVMSAVLITVQGKLPDQYPDLELQCVVRPLRKLSITLSFQNSTEYSQSKYPQQLMAGTGCICCAL